MRSTALRGVGVPSSSVIGSMEPCARNNGDVSESERINSQGRPSLNGDGIHVPAPRVDEMPEGD